MTTFETPSTAPYLTRVQPGLDANLGTPVDPRLAPFGATPSVVPTTSQSNKKTNVCIPYTRVCRTATNLGIVGSPVFVCARKEYSRTNARNAAPEMRVDILAGLDAVNRELAVDGDDEATALEWRLDGFLMNTQDEMDIEQARLFEPQTTTTSVLVAVQNPTTIRNLYSSRPMVGDRVYIGLVWREMDDGSERYQWVPFSSQHLDMEYPPGRPMAPQLGVAGICNRVLHHVTFSETERLCKAYCIGTIMDTAPSPGLITVNVQLRLMEREMLGIRHDDTPESVKRKLQDDHVGPVIRKKIRYVYNGKLGMLCPTVPKTPDEKKDRTVNGETPTMVYEPLAEPTFEVEFGDEDDQNDLVDPISNIVKTYEAVAVPGKTNEKIEVKFYEKYTSDKAAFDDFDGWLTSSTSLKILMRMLKNVKLLPEDRRQAAGSKAIKDIQTNLMNEKLLRMAAFLASKIASVSSVTLNDNRTERENERRAFGRLREILSDLWTRLNISETGERYEDGPLNDKYTRFLYDQLKSSPNERPQGLLGDDRTGTLLRLALVTEMVNARAAKRP